MPITSSWTDTINAAGNALSYFAGQCTRFVAETLSWVPAGLGNAGEWLSNAQAKGYSVGRDPVVGSVAVWGVQPGMPYGHVAVVKSLDPGGTITVAEENWLGAGVADTRAGVNPSGISGFIYAPGGGSVQPLNWGPGNLIPGNPPSVQDIIGAILNPVGAAAGAGEQAGQQAAQQGALGVAAVGAGISHLGDSFAQIPTTIGHGLADALANAETDVGVWMRRQAAAFFVAALVLLVLFL